MRLTSTPRTGDRRGLAATAVAVFLALAGVISIGVALSHRQSAPPEPALGSQGSPTKEPPAGSPTAPQATELVLPRSTPVALAIPAIGVRSALQRLGQTRAGTLEVPAPGPHYDEAGWYRFSPTPGSLGPSVIVGHVDSAADGPSIFFRLGSLRPHDKVRVTRADGTVAVFAVDDVRRYRKSHFPTQLVYGNTDHAALRLITCGGPLTPAGHYRDNIVVRASLVGSVGA
jgi:sortase (surface protein transpeptidase)